jgi:hypothetical protein
VVWYKQLQNRLAISAAIVGSIAVIGINIQALKTFIFPPGGDPQLTVRDPRVALYVMSTSGLFPIYMEDGESAKQYPPGQRFNRVSFILQKKYGIAAHKCSVVFGNGFPTGPSAKETDLGDVESDIAAREFEFSIKVKETDNKIGTFYVTCDGAVSNSVGVTLL